METSRVEFVKFREGLNGDICANPEPSLIRDKEGAET